jgi:hypothetical protein
MTKTAVDWNEIPSELLEIISFYVKADSKYTNRKDLAQCSSTCERWRDVMHPALYPEIRLYIVDETHIEKFRKLTSNNIMLNIG